MNKELIPILDTVLKVFELLAAVSGIAVWKKIKDTYWKWFVLYLILIVIAEFIGKYMADHKLTLMNRNMYHFIVIPGEFFFFFWIFGKQPNINGIRKTAWIGSMVYILLWFTDTFILSKEAYHGAFWFSSLSYSAGNLVLLILILQFIVQFVNSDEILYFRNNLLFWVSIGLLIFFLGTFPYYGIRNLMFNKFRNTFWIYTYVMMGLNCLMYLSFTIGFLWVKPNSTSLS